jgi:hypothetical protein
MSDMPERIWADVGRDPMTRTEYQLWCEFFDPDSDHRTEYIRADIAAEQLKEAWDDGFRVGRDHAEALAKAQGAVK